ncbi:MAG: response regulator transcription factor [Gammaproteobacteria bacterium]|nr:response regulator transcription factor [Gammaproteobacteria bacterium]
MATSNTNEQHVILIASGDQSVAAHYQRILESGYTIIVAATCSEMTEFLSRHEPALLVVDPLLYPETATDHISTIIRDMPDTHVIVIENQTDRVIEQNALFKAGAHGFCMDNIPDALLGKAVQLVLDGDYWVQRKLITQVIDEIASEQRDMPARSNFDNSLVDTLTPRELQVARMVHMGGNNKIIARELDISERTVKAHLSAIFRKLDIKNRLNLALYFSEIT